MTIYVDNLTKNDNPKILSPFIVFGYNDDDNLLHSGQLWFPRRLEDYHGPKPLRRRRPTTLTFIVKVMIMIVIVMIIIGMIIIALIISAMINDHHRHNH